MKIREDALARKAEAYLHEGFGLTTRLEPYQPEGLPYFIGDRYAIWQADLFGRPCLFLAPRPPTAPGVDEIARHMELARTRTETRLVILLVETLPSSRRLAFLARRLAFMVPKSQLFVPEAFLELRERPSRPFPKDSPRLSPTAQLVVLGALLEHEAANASATRLARRYGVATMSVTRAFDELEAAGLANTARQGVERSLRFAATGRELWNDAEPRLRSPVRKVRTVIARFGDQVPGRLAGESALSFYTDLASPRVRRLAVPAADWKVLARENGIRETDAGDPERVEIETWAYDPAPLGRDEVVDPLSLYLSVRHHPDERVAMAADELLAGVQWS
ncbi:MAG: hypothetical protein ACREEB_12460 [Caulobacteraceae bacterium]